MIYLLAMITFLYNLSPSIKKNLEQIEDLRKQILLTPLFSKKELRLSWEAKLERIYWSLNLSGSFGNKKHFIKVLTNSMINKTTTALDKEIIYYKKTIDYINDYWLASPKMITPKTITELSSIFTKNKPVLSENDLRLFLEYLEPKTEHPVIIAAIAQIQILRARILKVGNGRLSRLFCLLLLYKYGYDFRKLLVLEEYWNKNKEGFESAVENAVKTGNLTLWIEFFTDGVVNQLKKVLTNISSPSSIEGMSNKFFELTDRQKEILNTFDQPDVQITNKKVQKIFKVSQITASRDLSKLANLGLVLLYGKGRSVYYTKTI